MTHKGKVPAPSHLPALDRISRYSESGAALPQGHQQVIVLPALERRSFQWLFPRNVIEE
jgi:hypothetical protein